MEADSLTAPRPGVIQVDAVDEIGLLIGRNNYGTSCGNRLGGHWESTYSERRYDDDGPNRVIGLRLPLHCCCRYGGESSPPTNEHASNDEEIIV